MILQSDPQADVQPAASCSIRLYKAALVVGKSLSFRDATVADAAFILSLRTDSLKSRYLSAVSGALKEQQSWLEHYAQTTNQAYFIINYDNTPIGTVRLYDPQEHSFCWGSWILHNSAPRQAALESALMVYSYALDHLGFTAAHFDVRKGNERVLKFHERFGAVRKAESELDYFYKIDSKAILAAKEHYRRFLPDGVNVVF